MAVLPVASRGGSRGGGRGHAAGARARLGLGLRHRRSRGALRPETRAIVVNFPHNPTGAHVDRSSFERLVALAEGAGVALFSDEVYRWLEYDDALRLPAAVELSGSAVSLGVMSKTFALPGLRIGWLVSRDRDLLARLAAFKDYTTICSSAPSEVLADIGLKAVDRVVARSRAIVDANLVLLDDFFERHADAVEWVRPKAGPVAFPRMTAADLDVGAFCEPAGRRSRRAARARHDLRAPGTRDFGIGFGGATRRALARLEPVYRRAADARASSR